MYFHQDDLDWFILVNRPLIEVFRYPIGDHVNYLFRLLMYIEWSWFGFSFPPYLLVSVLMHAIVIWLIYLIAKASSGRRDLAYIAALLFSVNTNWTEVVLWVSGQTISITAIFVLLAMFAIWHKRGEAISMFLASWTSALAIGMMASSALVYKKLRYLAIGLLGTTALIYLLMGGDGTSIAISVGWVVQVVMVAGLMVVHTVIGRLLIPFDRFENERIAVVLTLLIVLSWRYREKLIEICHDTWARFLVCHLVIYYLIVAAGRAQFGVGIMRAERYGYIGLALILLLTVRVLRRVNVDKWMWVVYLLVSVQVAGLYVRANDYFERPNQLKNLVGEMKNSEIVGERVEDYLPRFVLNDDRLKYRDLIRLIHD